jgi:hypothetical protein
VIQWGIAIKKEKIEKWNNKDIKEIERELWQLIRKK